MALYTSDHGRGETPAMSDDREPYRAIGRRIREARAGRYSQEELGKVIGYTQTAFSKLERGETRISLPDLQRVARFLNRPLAYFLGSSPDAIGLKIDPKIADIMTGLDLTILPVYELVPSNEGMSFKVDKPSDYMNFPRALLKGATFAVRVAEDWLEDDEIKGGDVLLVRPQDDASPGDVVVLQTVSGACTVVRLASQEDLKGAHVMGKVIRIVRDI